MGSVRRSLASCSFLFSSAKRDAARAYTEIADVGCPISPVGRKGEPPRPAAAAAVIHGFGFGVYFRRSSASLSFPRALQLLMSITVRRSGNSTNVQSPCPTSRKWISRNFTCTPSYFQITLLPLAAVPHSEGKARKRIGGKISGNGR